MGRSKSLRPERALLSHEIPAKVIGGLGSGVAATA